jgi:hypothetical protein
MKKKLILFLMLQCICIAGFSQQLSPASEKWVMMRTVLAPIINKQADWALQQSPINHNPQKISPKIGGQP